MGDFVWRNGLGKTEDVEARRRSMISASNSGRLAWNRGKPHAEETKLKIRDGVLQTYREHPELGHETRRRQTGKKHSKETREKIRAARLRQLERDAPLRQRRLEVNARWHEILRIAERREELYVAQRSETARRKARKKALASRNRPPRMSSGHREKISLSIRRKWQDRDYRKNVEDGITRTVNLNRKIGVGHSFKLAERSELDRSILRKQQEEVKEKARRMLALAHLAADQLKTLKPGDSAGEDPKDPDASLHQDGDVLTEVADVEVRNALRSLNDADDLVNRLHKSLSLFK